MLLPCSYFFSHKKNHLKKKWFNYEIYHYHYYFLKMPVNILNMDIFWIGRTKLNGEIKRPQISFSLQFLRNRIETAVLYIVKNAIYIWAYLT